MSGFAPDAASSESKDLATRTILNKILKLNVYEIPRIHKYNGYQRALASMIGSECKWTISWNIT